MPVILTAPWYLFLGSVSGCLALGAWSWYSYQRSGMSIPVLVKAFLAVLTGPLWFWQLSISSLELHETTVRWTTGFSWERKAHSVDFSGVQAIRVTEVGSGRNRGEAWILLYRNGELQEVRLTDLWRSNREEIAEHFSARGISLPR